MPVNKLLVSFRKKKRNSSPNADASLDTASNSSSEGVEAPTEELSGILGRLATTIKEKSSQEVTVNEADEIHKNADKKEKKAKKVLADTEKKKLDEITTKLELLKKEFKGKSENLTQAFQEAFDNKNTKYKALIAAIEAEGSTEALYKHGKKTQEELQEKTNERLTAEQELKVAEEELALAAEPVQSIVNFSEKLTADINSKVSNTDKRLKEAHKATFELKAKLTTEIENLNKEKDIEKDLKKGIKSSGKFIEEAEKSKDLVQANYDASREAEALLDTELSALNEELEKLTLLFPNAKQQQELLSQLPESISRAVNASQVDSLSLASFSSNDSESSTEERVSHSPVSQANQVAHDMASTKANKSSSAPAVTAQGSENQSNVVVQQPFNPNRYI